jgi:hypothetical protein
MTPDLELPTLTYKKPETGPHVGASDDLLRWARLRESSRSAVSDSAAKWRAGTGGLVTVMTGLLLIKGQDSQSIADGWRQVIVGILVLATAAVMVSLWNALVAEAPPLTRTDYRDVLESHGSVAAYQDSVDRGGAERLRFSRASAIAGLCLFLIGTAAWLLAPRAEAASLITVTYGQQGNAYTVCGELVGTHAGDVLVRVVGQTQPVAVPLTEISGLGSAQSCPG